VIVEQKSPDGAAALEPYLGRFRVISFHEEVLRGVAGTVNDETRMLELIALGVDGLTTDDPALARRVSCTTP